jgi:hypothetical protein
LIAVLFNSLSVIHDYSVSAFPSLPSVVVVRLQQHHSCWPLLLYMYLRINFYCITQGLQSSSHSGCNKCYLLHDKVELHDDHFLCSSMFFCVLMSAWCKFSIISYRK